MDMMIDWLAENVMDSCAFRQENAAPVETCDSSWSCKGGLYGLYEMFVGETDFEREIIVIHTFLGCNCHVYEWKHLLYFLAYNTFHPKKVPTRSPCMLYDNDQFYWLGRDGLMWYSELIRRIIYHYNITSWLYSLTSTFFCTIQWTVTHVLLKILQEIWATALKSFSQCGVALCFSVHCTTCQTAI